MAESSQPQSQQEPSSAPNLVEGFIADRQVFWQRFMSFTMGSVIVLVALLVAMWLFVA